MKSVYTGGEKVAEFESYDELRIGDSEPAFIYEGDELVYPNPVKDGLVLWYDFSGRSNADGQRGIAEDLSGNGNHGTLQNFNYTTESGYGKNKLLFDGVDDNINEIASISGTEIISYSKDFYLEFIICTENASGALFGGGSPNDRNGAYIQNGVISFGNYNPQDGWNGIRTFQRIDDGLIKYIGLKKEGNRYNIIINGEEIRVWSANPYLSVSGLSFGYSSGVVGHGDISDRIFRYLSGEIYSIRMHNRPLTPEEIAHNYSIEKERFGIE